MRHAVVINKLENEQHWKFFLVIHCLFNWNISLFFILYSRQYLFPVPTTSGREQTRNSNQGTETTFNYYVIEVFIFKNFFLMNMGYATHTSGIRKWLWCLKNFWKMRYPTDCCKLFSHSHRTILSISTINAIWGN